MIAVDDVETMHVVLDFFGEHEVEFIFSQGWLWGFDVTSANSGRKYKFRHFPFEDNVFDIYGVYEDPEKNYRMLGQFRPHLAKKFWPWGTTAEEIGNLDDFVEVSEEDIVQ